MRQHPFLKSVYSYIKKHKAETAIVLGVLLAFSLFTEKAVAVSVLVVFWLVSTFTTIYKRFVRLPPVFEFIGLTTTMVTIFFGPITGIIYTIIVNFSSEVASGHPDEMTLTYMPSRVAQALFTHFAYTSGMITGIVALGTWSVVVFNAVQQPIFMSLVDAEKRLKALYFVALNIPLNILIFRLLGEPVFNLLSAIT